MVWVGTRQNGLVSFDGTHWVRYVPGNSGLPAFQVNSIFIDKDGTKLIGTSWGAAEFDGLDWKVYTSHNGLPVDGVYDMISDENGIKWFGTWGRNCAIKRRNNGNTRFRIRLA
jgi:hypothetical protein